MNKNRAQQDIEYAQIHLENIKKILSTLEVQTERDIYDWVSKYYRQQRVKFLDLCKKYGISAEGKLGLKKATVYRLSRYGEIGVVTKKERQKILERDGHKCQLCGNSPKILHIHHISSSRSKDDSNLISLCAKCHKQEERRLKHAQV